jgi:hypothetical protein
MNLVRIRGFRFFLRGRFADWVRTIGERGDFPSTQLADSGTLLLQSGAINVSNEKRLFSVSRFAAGKSR